MSLRHAPEENPKLFWVPGSEKPNDETFVGCEKPKPELGKKAEKPKDCADPPGPEKPKEPEEGNPPEKPKEVDEGNPAEKLNDVEDAGGENAKSEEILVGPEKLKDALLGFAEKPNDDWVLAPWEKLKD